MNHADSHSPEAQALTSTVYRDLDLTHHVIKLVISM